jgi:hypothetical protein
VQTEVIKVSRKGSDLTVDVIHNIGDEAAIWRSVVIIEVAKKDIVNVTRLRIVSTDN